MTSEQLLALVDKGYGELGLVPTTSFYYKNIKGEECCCGFIAAAIAHKTSAAFNFNYGGFLDKAIKELGISQFDANKFINGFDGWHINMYKNDEFYEAGWKAREKWILRNRDYHEPRRFK
jgi:hypothetical protein